MENDYFNRVLYQGDSLPKWFLVLGGGLDEEATILSFPKENRSVETNGDGSVEAAEYNYLKQFPRLYKEPEMTTQELRAKAVEGARKVQGLPRLLIGVEDKSWVADGASALNSVEGEAFLQKVISIHELRKMSESIKHSE